MRNHYQRVTSLPKKPKEEPSFKRRHGLDDGDGLGKAVWLGRFLLWPLCIWLLAHFVLPALADITPPGVSLDDVRAVAEKSQQQQAQQPQQPRNFVPGQAGGAAHPCQHKCVGLRCPEGWTTAPKHDGDGACKCICARVDANTVTAWDLKRREQAAKAQGGGPPQEEAPAHTRDPLHGPRDHHVES